MKTLLGQYSFLAATSFCMGISALAAESAIQPIAPGDLFQGVPGYAALGTMYRLNNLIWSGDSIQKLTQFEAESYCRSLGTDSRLPTLDEAKELTRALGARPGGDYNPDLISGLRTSFFWTSTLDPQDNGLAYFIYGSDAYSDLMVRKNDISVRCVTPSKEYRAGDLIWSAVGPYQLTQSDAEKYCSLQGQRLPSKDEFKSLFKLGSNTVPDMGRQFWTSSRSELPGAPYFFDGKLGVEGTTLDYSTLSVRCVR